MYDIKGSYAAASLEDATRALTGDENAVLIAGGSDVLIKIREGKLSGASLVSIRDIPGLSGVALDGGDIHIGPLTTFAEIEASGILKDLAPHLSLAAGMAGGPQLRNIGTIGGNVCNGATSADTAPALFTLNARLIVQGPNGRRAIGIEQFYKGPGKVDLSRGEILTDIVIAAEDYEGFGGEYIKYAMRNAMDIATLSCAAMCRLKGAAVDSIRLAYGVACPTPVRCHRAEALAAGQPLTAELLDMVAREALSEINPRTSWRASREFRMQLAGELARRALTAAARNAGGTL